MTQLTHKPKTHTGLRPRGPVSTLVVRPITDSRAAALSGAAERFLARPEIAEVFALGSNGCHAQLPVGNAARLALWQRWPDADRCSALARGLETQLSVPADAEHVADAIGGMLAAFPTGDRAAAGYREGLISIIIEEAGLRGWSAAAVGRGCLGVLRSSRFQPSAAEVIEAVAEAHRELCFAAWAAQQAFECCFSLGTEPVGRIIFTEN